MGLRDGSSLRPSFFSPSVEVGTLLGVREVLRTKDLEFSIFFADGEDRDRIVLEFIVVGGITRACGLCRGYMS